MLNQLEQQTINNENDEHILDQEQEEETGMIVVEMSCMKVKRGDKWSA